MLSYLRLTWNPQDDAAVRRVLNVPTRGIGASAQAQIEAFAEASGTPLLEAVSDLGLRESLGKKAAQGALGFVVAIEEARRLAEQGPITPVLMHLMNASGYLAALREEHSVDAESRKENLQELLNVTREYDNAAEGAPSLGEFLESVALVSDVDSLVDEGEAVTLMTLHSAKGLEFPVVFLVGMEEGVFPHSRSMNSDSELEEERRLCYVGMTRAKEELHLCHAARRALWGQANFNRPSRFLDDLPHELVSVRGVSPPTPYASRQVQQGRDGSYRTIETRPAPPPPGSDGPLRSPTWVSPFEVGQRVRHATFGIGVVVACNPIREDAEVTVAFPGVTGVKKLVQRVAKLEVV
jgi:DNA helicase-2/ATP-dependent DNA helicase PcrA